MGYRSEVILVVGKEVMPQFLVTLAKSSEARALCYHDTSKYIQNHEEEGTCLFYWDHIKWYDSFEEVQAIEDFLDWCDGEDIEVDGDQRGACEFVQFLRIGEELDDMEARGHGYYNVGINRSIDF